MRKPRLNLKLGVSGGIRRVARGFRYLKDVSWRLSRWRAGVVGVVAVVGYMMTYISFFKPVPLRS